MNSKTLLLKYLDSIGDPDRAAALFAEDGTLELPFLRSLGVGARYAGRREIAACLHQLGKLYPDVAFAPNDINVLIETPDKTFAEYESVDDGPGAATEWSRRFRATQPRGALVLSTSFSEQQVSEPKRVGFDKLLVQLPES